MLIKGCLHCHSTASDGRLSPEDVVRYYRSYGYKLIAITDHGKITHINYHDDVTILPGVELSRGRGKLGGSYHIVVLGVDDPYILEINDPQEVIDFANSLGGITLIAHPYWSGLTHEDLISIKNYTGIEIYNTGCDVEVAKGYSTVHWDNLISAGIKVWGFAVDDAHRYFVPPIDANGGWIWVNAPNNDEESIIKAIKRGDFYSSTGPTVYKAKITKTLLHVEFTPATRVNIISRNGKGICIHEEIVSRILKEAQEGRGQLRKLFSSVEVIKEKDITELYLNNENLKAKIVHSPVGLREIHIETKINYEYIRLEIIDREGKTAWLNPFIM